MGLEEHAECLSRELGRRGCYIHCKRLLVGLCNLEGQSNWPNEGLGKTHSASAFVCACVCEEVPISEKVMEIERQRWKSNEELK